METLETLKNYPRCFKVVCLDHAAEAEEIRKALPEGSKLRYAAYPTDRGLWQVLAVNGQLPKDFWGRAPTTMEKLFHLYGVTYVHPTGEFADFADAASAHAFMAVCTCCEDEDKAVNK